MTREEAIQVLNMVEAHGVADTAKRMAIEALSADSDCVSRKIVQNVIQSADDGEIPYTIVKDIVGSLPSAEPKSDEESELKFYYVESIDDYWVGRRLDNFYYANWHEGLGFVWLHSRYLPWGEHIVDENTLWKEHTYLSEPKEIQFTDWIVGFLKKYSIRQTGGWIPCFAGLPEENKEVLINLAWGIDIGEYREDGWHSEWINHYDDDNVIAWMPLPEPYKRW